MQYFVTTEPISRICYQSVIYPICSLRLYLRVCVNLRWEQTLRTSIKLRRNNCTLHTSYSTITYARINSLFPVDLEKQRFSSNLLRYFSLFDQLHGIRDRIRCGEGNEGLRWVRGTTFLRFIHDSPTERWWPHTRHPRQEETTIHETWASITREACLLSLNRENPNFSRFQARSK